MYRVHNCKIRILITSLSVYPYVSLHSQVPAFRAEVTWRYVTLCIYDPAGIRQSFTLMFCPGFHLPNSPLFAMQMKPAAELFLALLSSRSFLPAQASLQSLFCPLRLSCLSGMIQCLAYASCCLVWIWVLFLSLSAESQSFWSHLTFKLVCWGFFGCGFFCDEGLRNYY